MTEPDKQPPAHGDSGNDPLAERVLADVSSVGSVPPAAPTPSAGSGQIRRVGSQTAVYAIGVLVGRGLSFLLLPLYTRYLSPADYGVIQLIELAFDVLTLVAGVRLASGVYYFYFKAEDQRARNEVRSTATIAVTSGYFIVGIFAFLFADRLSVLLFKDLRFADTIRVAAACFPLHGLVIVPLQMIKAQERPAYFVALTTARLVGQALLNVLFLVVFELGLISMFLSTLITTTILAAWLITEQIREAGLRFSPPVFRALARYGLPFILTQVATIFVTFGDRFFLQRAGDSTAQGVSLAGEAAVGLYALAYQFGFLLQSVGVEPFTSVWNPIRFDLAKRSDRDLIFANAFLLLNILVMTLAMGIALFVHDVIRLLAAPAFHEASRLVPVVLLAYVFQAWGATQDTGIRVTERTGWDTVANWSSALVALVGYIVLIPRYLGFGAAWATVASLAVRHLIIYLVSQRLWPIRYRWAPIMRLMLLAISLAAVRLLAPPMSLAGSLLVSVALFGLYLLGVIYLRILPDTWRSSLGAVVRNPRSSLPALLGSRT